MKSQRGGYAWAVFNPKGRILIHTVRRTRRDAKNSVNGVDEGRDIYYGEVYWNQEFRDCGYTVQRVYVAPWP